MKKLLNAVLSVILIVAALYLGITATHNAQFMSQVAKAKNALLSEMQALPSQWESLINRLAGESTSSSVPPLLRQGAKILAQGNDPSENVVTYDQSSPSSSAQGAGDQAYSYTGLRLYPYGRSLLNAQEAACYDKIASSVNRYDRTVKLPYKVDITDAFRIFNYYMHDHPETFYLKKMPAGGDSVKLGVQFAVYSGTTSVAEIYLDYQYTPVQINAMKKSLQNSVQTILSVVNSSMSDEKKLKAIYDEAKREWSYDFAAQGNPNENLISYESYGALVNHTAVCQGYADAMKILLDTAGFSSIVVTGDAYNGEEWGGHAWNAVCVDGKWRYIDATFDDTGNYSSDQYLHMTVAKFLRVHRPDAFSPTVPYDAENPGSYENYATMPLTVG